MESLDAAGYALLVADGIPIKEMREGVKVWRLPDGRMVKLFRPRGLLSRSRLQPANRRFARNAAMLSRLGFVTVTVQQLFYNQENGCFGVVYAELPGRTLEQAFAESPSPALIESLAQLLVDLHQHGVLFRSLHLGNVVWLDSGLLGLIDVEELNVSGRALGVRSRVRNFRHLLRRELDRNLLTVEGFQSLASGYLSHCGLSARRNQQLSRWLEKLSDEVDWP